MPPKLNKFNPVPDFEAISPEEKKTLLDEYVKPHLAELLRKEVEAALGAGKDATITRGRVLDRFFGKAGEAKPETNKQTINLIIRQKEEVDSLDALTSALTVSVEPPSLPLPSPRAESESSKLEQPVTEATFRVTEIDPESGKIIF